MSQITTNQIKDIVRSVTEDLWGKGQFELVDRYFSEDFVNHDPPEGFSADRDGYRDAVQTFYNALSNVEAEVSHIVVEGNYAAMRWTMSGVHAGELFGVPATHQTIEAGGIGIARFEDGQIAEEWNQIDTLGLLQQLGVIPETA